MAIAGERAEEAKERAQAENEELDLTGREKEQRTRRAMRGAEREEILLCLEELEAWYRDLVVVAAGAESAAAHVDRLDQLREDASVDVLAARDPDEVEVLHRPRREGLGPASPALRARFRGAPRSSSRWTPTSPPTRPTSRASSPRSATARPTSPWARATSRAAG